MRALEILGASKDRAGFPPYAQETNGDMEVRFLASHGIHGRARAWPGNPRTRVRHGDIPERWFEETVALRDPAADAYFLSCTAIRAAEAVEPLERELGRPVITSNQAALWRTLRDAGIEDCIEGYGRLLSM